MSEIEYSQRKLWKGKGQYKSEGNQVECDVQNSTNVTIFEIGERGLDVARSASLLEFAVFEKSSLVLQMT